MAVALHPVVYWTAGLLIAFPSEAASAFYGQSIDAIDPAALLALQIVRGGVWVGLAVLLTRALGGGAVGRAIPVGAAFSVFRVAQLLYPTEVLPADARWIHFIEITVSNLLYGVAAALLVDGRRTATAARHSAG